MTSLRIEKSGALTGCVRVPGDKSISHRSLIFGTLAVGETRISGLLEGEDVLATAQAMRQFGATIEKDSENIWHVHGVGVGGLTDPDMQIDMGNAGTGARLIMGLAATHDITACFVGDGSLSKRPMGRVTDPLEKFGAVFTTSAGKTLPLMVRGNGQAAPLEYRVPVPSAQVKSAVLLAGLNVPGLTKVIEPIPTRDHTERMLHGFGANISVERLENGETEISLMGQPELKPCTIQVPADPSSAAFPLAAALVTPGSDVTVEGVCMNPLRTGLFECFKEMGANIQFLNQREEGGEPAADIRVQYGPLKGITVPPERAPSMIDEYPVLACVSSFAQGKTTMLGIEEMRVKESDRISVMSDGLKACGVQIEERPDGMIVSGCGGNALVPGGATITTHLDHRIAMSFLILGLGAENTVVIDDGSVMNTSFPGFVDLMKGLGAAISE